MTSEIELGPPDYVVLGMIRHGAKSGYAIRRAVDVSIRFFWTISPAQIYPSLARLERTGLVRGKSEPLGKRRRRTFILTRTGEMALLDWLRRKEEIPFELRDIGMVKLFFADGLHHNDAQTLLIQIQQRSERQLAMLRSILPEAERLARGGEAYPLLTLHMGIAFHEAIIELSGNLGKGSASGRRRGETKPSARRRRS